MRDPSAGIQNGTCRPRRNERIRSARLARIRSVTFAPGTSIRPTSRSRPAHEDRRPARADGVAVPFEPQQQGVAAELEQAAAVFVGDEQDRLEAASDRIGDLFGALASLAGEPLGQLREARNVDEDGAAFAGPAASGRIVDEMLLENAGHVRNGPLRVRARASAAIVSAGAVRRPREGQDSCGSSGSENERVFGVHSRGAASASCPDYNLLSSPVTIPGHACQRRMAGRSWNCGKMRRHCGAGHTRTPNPRTA